MFYEARLIRTMVLVKIKRVHLTGLISNLLINELTSWAELSQTQLSLVLLGLALAKINSNWFSTI